MDVGQSDVNWIHPVLGQSLLATCCEHGDEPSCSITAWSNWRPAVRIRPETACNQEREIIC
jgi:hypothetical protein